jgi:two-component system, chemotaxis family, chemotaxis protein CheY
MPTPVSRSSLALDFSLLSFLIVDDQPFSRKLVRSMLLGFGSRDVYESVNGVEAFETARTVRPSIVITDLVMPMFNGLRFIKMMKEPQSPAHRTPIIVLSGYLTEAAALAVRSSGADELLVKPVSPKTLYEHIARSVLRRDAVSEPSVFAQNRKRRADQQRAKPRGLAYI